jgi:hypothetical protein
MLLLFLPLSLNAGTKIIDSDLYQMLIESVVGTYEGKITWDGEEASVTTHRPIDD